MPELLSPSGYNIAANTLRISQYVTLQRGAFPCEKFNLVCELGEALAHFESADGFQWGVAGEDWEDVCEALGTLAERGALKAGLRPRLYVQLVRDIQSGERKLSRVR